MQHPLPIGTKLYRHCFPYLMSYKITGIRIYETGKPQYEAESLVCKGHDACKVLVGINDTGKMIHIEMLNNNGSNEWDTDERHWHLYEDGPYFVSVEEARIYRLDQIIKGNEEAVKTAKTNLTQREKALADSIEKKRLVLAELQK